jgi:hypothetical protein
MEVMSRNYAVGSFEAMSLHRVYDNARPNERSGTFHISVVLCQKHFIAPLAPYSCFGENILFRSFSRTPNHKMSTHAFETEIVFDRGVFFYR